ncbi:MAG TPA: polyphenol oxidase family protein [Longimicrobiales bacterium]|nr:polyphenol oxidase family protein [Longimicrobiales bacterium]
MTIGSGQGSARRIAEVREVPVSAEVPLYVHPDWAEEMPWLVQGTTARGGSEEPFDLGAWGSTPSGTLFGRWAALLRATGSACAVHARQVHGAEVLWHEGARPGFWVGQGVDGHGTRTPGVLLTVSVADCVPVFLVDERTRAVALLHAGWRGVAAGILTAGIQVLEREAGSEPSDLRVHLGPSICGTCYEVGPEVHEALGLTPPAAPRPVDLRQVLAEQALALGVRAERISRSAYCTRCGDSPFFSHRRGDSGRQFGVLGVRGHGGAGAVEG